MEELMRARKLSLYTLRMRSNEATMWIHVYLALIGGTSSGFPSSLLCAFSAAAAIAVATLANLIVDQILDEDVVFVVEKTARQASRVL